MQEQSFFHGVLQTYGRDWIRFDKGEKKFTYKAFVVALKKKLNFRRLHLYFPDFFQV